MFFCISLRQSCFFSRSSRGPAIAGDPRSWLEFSRSIRSTFAQDTYYAGIVRASRRIDKQTFIDTYANVASAKPYDRENALVAVDLANESYRMGKIERG
jgi:hypothetical protein